MRASRGAMLKKVLLSLLIVSAFLTIASAQGNVIYLLKIDGIINPASAGYIVKGIDKAEQEGASCLVIEMDTPGGLMESMRSIVKRILSARVPVIVYVAPAGSRAGSAGVFITMAANIAAMAPGTNIGAAHPVQMGEKETSKEMEAKILNDTVAYIKTIAKQRGRNEQWAEKAVRESVSVKEDEALKLGVIDLVSPSLKDLLSRVDGRRIELSSDKVVALKTEGLEIKTLKMSFRDQFLSIISNPNIALILFLLGVYGLLLEFWSPGAIFPGVVGGICIILAFFAFQMLPINYAGIALILLGVILFIAEIKITSYGILSIGGVISLLLGSIMLIDSPAEFLRISFVNVILPVVVVSAGFFLFALTMVVRAHRRRPTTGKEGLIGKTGVATIDLKPEGVVEIRGELWNAVAEEEIKAGEKIQVEEMEGMKVKVIKI
ncbi:MAG: serine protease [Deltaproteobacteria bacterium RBG_13_52_11]|nr:MAG: serine protease [Deltaproteobacteria bacterium RBG_13_52_11]